MANAKIKLEKAMRKANKRVDRRNRQQKKQDVEIALDDMVAEAVEYEREMEHFFDNEGY